MQKISLEPLLEALCADADDTYRIFNEGLIPGSKGYSIGVRMPALRKHARRILKENPRAFLDASLNSAIHEINLLHAIVLAALPCDFHEKLELLSQFVPTVANWAVCDVLCNDLRPDETHLEPLWQFLQSYLISDREFEVRFALVMLMLRFHSDAWIDRTLQAYADFRHPSYYAQMGAAWGLSMLFVHQREKALHLLQNNTWDRFTHNKAIQKIVESRQVSSTDKQLVRTMKRQES